MNLSIETREIVRRGILASLSSYRPDELVGVSCIAPGADSIFADAVHRVGGSLVVILPAADYRDRKVPLDFRDQFDFLVSVATTVHILPFPESNREAYEAANERMLLLSDLLFAVWDGQGVVHRGGTAATVHLAQARGLPVEIIWPAGASRS